MPVAFLGVLVGLAATCPALFMPGISALEAMFIYLIVSVTTVFMQALVLALPSKTVALQDR